MHIKNNKRIISAISSALILFFFSFEIHASLPLTETVYTIPYSRMTVLLREEFPELNSYYRKENYSLGFGILPKISLWYSFDYLHNRIINASSNTLGDSFLKIWYYIGDFRKICHAGFILLFRIPTGPNAYTDSEWRNISLGKNELKLGPVFKIDFKKSIYIHTNLFYVFRQGQDEDFYDGFHINLTKKETYSAVFGLNFKSKEAFLYSDRLKNDYAVFSAAANTDIIYPFVPYMEFYTSHRVYKNADKNENISIEGAEINPILFSAGGRYFFSDEILLGFYYIVNPKREKNFIKSIIGFDFSLQF